MRYKYCIVMASFFLCVYAFANTSVNPNMPPTSGISGSRYDSRIESRQMPNSSSYTPPSSTYGSSAGSSYYRGVIPYRSYDGYTGLSPSITGSLYRPLDRTQYLQSYPKTASGANISNIAKRSSALPYITPELRGTKSGLVDLDEYTTNRAIARTYVHGADFRPFTENISDFEYLLENRNVRTPESVLRDRELLTRKYMIDLQDRMAADMMSMQQIEAQKDDAQKDEKSDNQEDAVAGVFDEIRKEQQKAGLSGQVNSAESIIDSLYSLDVDVQPRQGDEQQQEEARKQDAEEKTDILQDRAALRRKAKAVLGEHKSFAAYSEDRFNTYMKRAEDFMDEGEYYRAADSYALATIFRKDDPLVYAGRSLALLGAGEYMSSSFYLNKAMLLYPDFVALKVDLGELLGSRDVLDNRIVDIQRWLERSGSGELSFLLSYIYYQLDEPDWAKDVLEKSAGHLPFKKNAEILAEMVGAELYPKNENNVD